MILVRYIQIMTRDEKVASFLNDNHIELKTFKDQVVFEKDDIVKGDGTPYMVYTPYMKLWKATFRTLDFKSFPSELILKNLISSRF